MSEIFGFILKILAFKIPIVISFKTMEIGYITLFGCFVVFFVIFLIGYIIKKLMK